MTTRTRILAALLLITMFAATAIACEGDKLCMFANVAVDRCFARNATLTFDAPSGKRIFITISADDARRLRDLLNSSYPVTQDGRQ